jgi:hypothetical protein
LYRWILGHMLHLEEGCATNSIASGAGVTLHSARCLSMPLKPGWGRFMPAPASQSGGRVAGFRMLLAATCGATPYGMT